MEELIEKLSEVMESLKHNNMREDVKLIEIVKNHVIAKSEEVELEDVELEPLTLDDEDEDETAPEMGFLTADDVNQWWVK